MENGNTWSWDNGDERTVSSVYRDTKVEDHEAGDIEAKAVEAESINEKDTEAEAIGARIAETQDAEEKSIENQDNTANAFILVGEPKSSAPQKDSSFTQPEFQPIALSQNIQQAQGEKRQRSAQNQSTAYKAGFSEEDISENKVEAMAAYLLGPVGIIIALLMSAESPYAKFHVRQALKLTVSSVILEIFAAVLVLFGMIPFVGIIFKLVLVLIGAAWLGVLVLRLIAIVQVCDGEAREPAVIGNLNFFK